MKRYFFIRNQKKKPVTNKHENVQLPWFLNIGNLYLKGNNFYLQCSKKNQKKKEIVLYQKIVPFDTLINFALSNLSSRNNQKLDFKIAKT